MFHLHAIQLRFSFKALGFSFYSETTINSGRSVKLELIGILPLGLLMLSQVGCVQINTDNDVFNATAAVITGIYMQKKIDEQKTKSAKQDIFKATDPKVKQLDQAIEKARRRTQLESSISNDLSPPTN